MRCPKASWAAVVFSIAVLVGAQEPATPPPCDSSHTTPCTMNLEVTDSNLQPVAGYQGMMIVVHVIKQSANEKIEETLMCSPSEDRKHCGNLVEGEIRAFVLHGKESGGPFKNVAHYTITEGGRELTFVVTKVARKPTDEAVVWQKALAEMTHPPDTDLSHFPLRVAILEAKWQQNPGGGSTGDGRGDVRNGESVMAFTFTVPGCAETLSVSAPGKPPYAGKWLEESQRLLLLVSVKIGEASELHQCELETKVLPNNVFLRNSASGAIEVLTQDEFKARREKQKAAQAEQQQSASAEARTQVPPVGNTTQKVSITSNPDGADIEVDGAFVGSTPSVIELGAGEHSVVIRKQGYASWERKLKLEGGDVKLNADLEKAPGGR